MADRDKLTANDKTNPPRPRSPAALLAQEETGPLLERICSEVSGTAGADFVEISNSKAAHSKLHDLLPTYFYTWQLQSPESVIVFLLLHWFLGKRDYGELLNSRRDYESHIERLKERVAQLEEELEPSLSGGSHSASEQEETLRRRVEELETENRRLTADRDRVRGRERVRRGME